jgi:hypothetical protein
MRKPMLLISIVACLGATLACDASAAGTAAATVTALPSAVIATDMLPTAIVTITEGVPAEMPAFIPATHRPTQTLAPSSVPTKAPPTLVKTAEPSATPRPPTQPPTPVPTPSPLPPVEPPSGEINRVRVFMVAVGDHGQAGPGIGCGDSMIAIDREIAPTNTPLTAAISELLSIKEPTYAGTGLQNALYASNLKVDGVSIEPGGAAIIYLSGTVSLAGECEAPRFEAQIVYTAKQFESVSAVAVYINGTAMHAAVGGKR